MLFGNHWALIGVLLGLLFAFSGLRYAIRGGRKGNGKHRSGDGIWVAVSVAVSLAFAALCVVAPGAAGSTAHRVARQFDRAVRAATGPRSRPHARVEHRPANASNGGLETAASVEHGTLRYAHTRAPWLSYTGLTRGSLVWNGLLALAIAALLYVGYAFLDAATRGYFTWRLRFLSIVAFIAFFAAMAALRAPGVADL